MNNNLYTNRQLPYMKMLIQSKLVFILGMGLLLAAGGCHKDSMTSPAEKGTIHSSFQMTNGGQSISENQVIAVNNQPPLKLRVMTFYMTNVRLVKADGSEQSLRDVLLINFDPRLNTKFSDRDTTRFGTQFTFADVVPGSYASLKFRLGTPVEVNGEVNPSNYDPSKYAAGHPYSRSAGMYWDSWKRYRHLILEADMDDPINGQFLSSVTYHTGFDSLTRDVNISYPIIVIKDKTADYKINFDIAKIFNGAQKINLPSEKYTEMGKENSAEGILGQKVMDNLSHAFSISE